LNLKKLLIYHIFFIVLSILVNAQTTQVQFGKNRVQYKKIKWQTIETTAYDLYFYDDSKEIANYVQTIAEKEIERLIEVLSYSYRQKLDILVFNNLQDYVQHNIGLNSETFNIGGTAKIYENKIFIYFNGNHQTLQNDLTYAISNTMIKQMMKGESFGQKFTNLLLLRLPEWYKIGVNHYVAYDWNSKDDDELRQLFLSEKNISFNKLNNKRIVLAGKSFWNMIAEEYGTDAIGNILYLTRINHKINDGFKIATGKSLERLMNDWHNFYKERYELDAENREDFTAHDVILKSKNNNVTQFISNSIGNKQAFVLNNEKNAYKVFVTENNKTKKIISNRLKFENDFIDYNNPTIAWSKDGNLLAIIENKSGKTKIVTKDFAMHKKSKKTILDVEAVFGVDFTFNNDNLVLSAQKNGQTDLYLYNLSSNTLKQINNTIFDDLYPKVIKLNNKENILFSSNYALSEIGNIATYKYENLDLFLMDLNGKNSTRLTESSNSNEFAIGSYDANSYTFLSDENGINNQYSGYVTNLFIDADTIILNQDTIINENYKQKGINSPISNFKYNIKHLAVSNNENFYIFENKLKKKNVYQIQKNNKTNTLNKLSIKPTSLVSNIIEPKVKSENVEIKKNKPTTGLSEHIDSIYLGNFPYTFQNKFNHTITSTEKEKLNEEDDKLEIKVDEEDEKNKLSKKTNTNKFINYINPNKSKSVLYKSKFSTDFFAIQLDNTLLQTYQSVAQNLSSYRFPKVGVLMSVGISDILENHKLKASIRVPFSFDRTEINIRYDNLKNKIDKYISIYRRSNKINFRAVDSLGNYLLNYLNVGKTITYVAEAGISYPFDYAKSIRLSTSYRNEKFVPLYTEYESLFYKTTQENWISAKLEYVQDNTKDIQFNIPTGFKLKVFAEYFNNINQKKSNIYNFGFDIRYYQKIYKNFIWANRLAYATSFGNQKILYFLGGVDAWLNQKYDNDTPIDENVYYGLQAPVNNMRGLPQNIRNGNNYLLWNSELRLPLFSFLSKKPIQSDFIRDFQLIGFFDAGMAYSKFNPFDKENAYIQSFVNDPIKNSLVVKAKYYRNPFVYGFGAGVRTNILGYFIRIDAGWGNDGNSINSKPIWHLSLSKDF
jgi:hypothetical protein